MQGGKPPHHPITSAASLRRLYVLLLIRPGFRRAYLRLLKTIYGTYVRPQFFQGRGHGKIPLDTELDAGIPFDPTWLPCYLGFVRLWAGSLGWLHCRFGDRALPEMEGFLEGMGSLFHEARRVFSEQDSTMASRPGCWPTRAGTERRRLPGMPSLNWLLIQLADRNSFCFPSLHVMIVRFNAVRMAAILDRLREPGQDFSAEKAFLEDRALRIVESIVHVKQHSLSDIPAGLFLLSNMEGTGGHPPVTAGDDARFLERLFPGADARPRAFLIALYDRLHRARQNADASPQAGAAREGETHAVLLAFLRDYRKEVGKLLPHP